MVIYMKFEVPGRAIFDGQTSCCDVNECMEFHMFCSVHNIL